MMELYPLDLLQNSPQKFQPNVSENWPYPAALTFALLFYNVNS